MNKWKPLLTPMGVCHKLELFGDAEYQKMKPLKQSNSVLGLIIGVNLRIVTATNPSWSIGHELLNPFDVSNKFTLRPTVYGPYKMTMKNDFVNIWKVIPLLDGMDIELGYHFTITTGHKLRSLFADFLISWYIPCCMQHIICFI